MDRPDLVACAIAADRLTDTVGDLYFRGLLEQRGVHVIWGVPHLCRATPVGMIHVDQTEPSWN